MTIGSYGPGPIACEGAAINDFRLTSHLPPEAAPDVIERDRLHMAARPGFNRKLLPLGVDRATGTAYSGGRYLFSTYANARAFVAWAENEFELDGTLIFKRPDFTDIEPRVFRVLGAHDFKDLHQAQQVCRTEIWSLDTGGSPDSLAALWPSLRDEAAERGLSSLWLLHDEEQRRICLVTVAQSMADSKQNRGPDFSSIEALESAPSQGIRWEKPGRARKTFDRTHWIFSIWFPRVDGKDLEPSLWPNSPPLPAPDIGLTERKRA